MPSFVVLNAPRGAASQSVAKSVCPHVPFATAPAGVAGGGGATPLTLTLAAKNDLVPEPRAAASIWIA